MERLVSDLLPIRKTYQPRDFKREPEVPLQNVPFVPAALRFYPKKRHAWPLSLWKSTNTFPFYVGSKYNAIISLIMGLVYFILISASYRKVDLGMDFRMEKTGKGFPFLRKNFSFLLFPW